jgi:hypothetical protein
VRYEVAPGEYLLTVDGVARFHVTRGTHIRYETAEGADAASVRLFLIGRPLGAVLLQRGMLALHAGAVRVGEECVAFAGPSGMGKSTLVAALRQRGYEPLADELCALVPSGERGFLVAPGLARIKLWADAARRLGEDTALLEPVRKGLHKYWVGREDGFASEPLRLRRLYLLRTSNRKEVDIVPVRGAGRLQAFLGDTYAKQLLSGMGARPEHFLACAEAARQASVSRLVRPRDGFSLPDLLAALEKDLAR